MDRKNKIRALHREIDDAKKTAERYAQKGEDEWTNAKTEVLLAYEAGRAHAEGYADGIRHALEVLGEIRP